MSKLLGLWADLLAAYPDVDFTAYGVRAIRILAIIAGLIIAGKVGSRLINGLMRPDRIPGVWDESRIRTMRGLVNSLLRYSLYFIGTVMVLDELGVPTSSVLAGAGIVGLAIGFGAQNLVRDVITGFFILFEDQFVVGDYVTIAGITGTVEDIGLRVTRIREATGELHIISNGEIKQVANMCRGPIGVLVEVSIAYEQDLDRVIETIEDAVRRVAAEHREMVLEEPRVLGVSGFGDTGVILQVAAKVRPMQQWAFERLLRKGIKDALDEAGITISRPQQLKLELKGLQEGGEAGGVSGAVRPG